MCGVRVEDLIGFLIPVATSRPRLLLSALSGATYVPSCGVACIFVIAPTQPGEVS